MLTSVTKEEKGFGDSQSDRAVKEVILGALVPGRREQLLGSLFQKREIIIPAEV